MANELMDWPAAAERYGILSVCLLGLGIFLVKKVWPFFTDQVNKSWLQVAETREDLKRSQERFLEALKVRDEQLISALDRQSAAIDRIASNKRSR